MPVIAHLSDPHLDASPGRLRRLEAVLEAVASLPQVDAIVLSGDLADRGRLEEYAQLFAALHSDVPTLVTPGNHDDSATMSSSLVQAGRDASLVGILDVGELRLIGLDSHIDGRDEGRLSTESLNFARAAAASAVGEVILVLHHPPVPVGHDVADLWGLENPEDLADLIAQHPCVIALFTGHVHTAFAATFRGLPVLGAPGIVSTMRLGSKVDPIADDAAMPGLAVHVIADATIRTVFHYLSPAEL